MTAARTSCSQLAHLSGERLRQETLKLLKAPRGPETWGQMLEAGIVAAYLPEAIALSSLQQVARREAALQIVPSAIRRLASLLATKTDALGVGTKLRLSRREQERLTGIAAGPEILLGLDAAAVRRLIYRYGNDLALDLILVHSKGEEGMAAAVAMARDWQVPRLPVSGKDLGDLGIQPGAVMGQWLALAESWWIAGDFRADRAACLDWLKLQMTDN
jgi:poly(A) polymerase